MPKRRFRIPLEGTLLSLMSLSLLGGLIALGFLQNISKENRTLIVIASSVIMIGCFSGMIFITLFRKWLRRRTWLKSISTWKESSGARIAPNFGGAGHLSEDGLRQLAIRIFSRMGYRVLNGEDKAVYIYLINPDGEIELVACRQQPDVLELHHAYSLQLEMDRVKAKRGFFLAPAGFTSEAIHWAAHRAIFLADQDKIARLAHSAFGEGSRYLER